MTTVEIILACLVVVLVMRYVMRYRRNRALNCVRAPKVLMLDLSDGLDADLVQADRAVYGPEFSEVTVSTRPDILDARRFDIVHVFGRSDGECRMAGITAEGLMSLVAPAMPRLVILATPTPPGYVHSSITSRFPFNVIVTGDRRGDNFVKFLRKLFFSMFQGKAFALSWVTQFPQDDGPGRDDEPVTFCALHQPGLWFAAA